MSSIMEAEAAPKDKIFIEIELKTQCDGKEIYTNLESFLALYVYKYIQSPKEVDLYFVSTELPKGKIQLNYEALADELLNSHIITRESSKTQAIRDLRLPIYEKDGNTFIAGMCAVCRELVGRDVASRKLLGFKQSCLLAPAEASVWTRFCEVDIVKAISKLLRKSEKDEAIEELPQEVSRFEKHMNQPVRMHNIYKLAREQALSIQKNSTDHKKEKLPFDNNIPKEQLQIEHRFAEGVAFTIADILLFPCMRIVFEYCPGMEQHFPLTNAWLMEIDAHEPNCSRLLSELRTSVTLQQASSSKSIRIVDCEAFSLYKSDPKRYKPKNRIYTEQSKVDAALSKLHTHFKANDFSSDRPNDFEEKNIDWSTIEPAHEKSSALPQERLARKRQQLENMANAAAAIAAPGDRIVDFCSGTGHLGILLGLQLRECTIILIENKANSLERAKKRAKDLNLKNCHFYQCNIDYFIGDFDLGTSLHACGSATDVVLQQCRRSRAKFVCCPCCYGSLCSMEHILYPLSNRFRNVLAQQDFMYIAHAADQAHELGVTNCRPETAMQGKYCMDIVDSDRKFCNEEAGYKVILTRLKPEQCTPKNRLLVGWCDQRS